MLFEISFDEHLSHSVSASTSAAAFYSPSARGFALPQISLPDVESHRLTEPTLRRAPSAPQLSKPPASPASCSVQRHRSQSDGRSLLAAGLIQSLVSRSTNFLNVAHL